MAKAVDILLVEDHPPDITLTQLGIGRFNNICLHVVNDGRAALEFLYQQEQFHAAPRPKLILLDLSLPKVNGMEVLENIKSNPALSRIPVIILSSSRAEIDIIKAYDLRANAYVVKPLKAAEFSEAIKTTNDFWLKTAILPNGGGI